MKFNYGVYTVIPTYFDSRNIDLDSIYKNINFQISNSIKNIVLLGTTSETPTLTEEEKFMIVKNVWDKFNDKINIIVGIGTNSTKSTLENAFVFREFCHAFMITSPYYNKPSQEGIYQHIATVAQLIEDKPILLYNIPSRCGVSMSPKIISDLYNGFENIKAIKEASGSIQQTLEISQLCDITVLSGDDSLTLPLMSIGAKGVVSVASNIIPDKMIELVELYRKGNNVEACELNYKLLPLFKSLFLDTNPVPLKYLSHKLGFSKENTVRLPLINSSNKIITDELDRHVKNLDLNIRLNL